MGRFALLPNPFFVGDGSWNPSFWRGQLYPSLSNSVMSIVCRLETLA